ncbi:hypothetical protein SRS16CHR_00164 [Variovorax sp. SRS16]|uniref:hypothetical protein n=1 Tax=Variovorax sp. SRS16 TaxID=282217 RepID=UPI001319A9C3|nr:hypothetical protein [Variovorax sp. SRS16]VTU12925.1 hypothetical protein SRS16CHR_00164 [Variovorax sp. SRS16]
MTSFVHVEQPSTHPGVARAEAFVDRIRAARRGLSKFGGLAALLLAAMVSSVVVVADKLLSTWDDGGMVAAWAILWFVAFAGIAFFAGTARSFAVRTVAAVGEASRRREAARADAEFMAYAQFDPRVLRELQAISMHNEAQEMRSAA